MRRGTCLCGAVKIEVRDAFEHPPEACHCRQCRKQSGHVLAAINVRHSTLKVEGEDSVTWYRSSPEVRRGFCCVCGSTLFWSPTLEGYEYVAVAMGLFDEPTGTRLAKHTFVGDKGDYYDLDDGVPRSDAY